MLREGRVLLGYGLTFDQAGRERTDCDLHPVTVAVLQPPEESAQTPYFHATGAVCSLPLLSQAAGASGFLNAAPDADGILRRVPIIAELDGRLYPGLALAAVRAATGSHDMTLRVLNVNASMLEFDDLVVPLDGKGNLLARYRGKKGTFSHLSAADILNNRLPAAAVRDKIVLVGTTALGTREVVATPLDTLFAGVEVQATIADNLLERTFNRRSALGSVLDFQVVLVFGLAVSILVATAGVIPGIISGVLGIAAALDRLGLDALEAGPVRIAALPDDWHGLRARADDLREVRPGAAPGRRRRPAADRCTALDGANASVADRDPRRRDRPPLAAHTALCTGAGAGAVEEPGLQRLPHVRADRLCCRASRRFTTSARSGSPITFSTSPGR